MIDNKLIARTVLGTIGGTPKVVEYWDNEHKSKIDVFSASDRPYEGVSSFSTIGLSSYPIDIKTNYAKELRIEFIGACANNSDMFANIISSCAFNIINSKYSCSPGTVFPNVVSEYHQNKTMKHIYFTSPFLWERINNLDFDEVIVTWLMIIPISDSEFDFIKKNGSEELEALFEKSDIDIFDLNRKSIV